MNIYEKVIELCNERNTTKTALEEACGFSQNSINKWRDSVPSIERIIKVADHFNVPVDYLLGREITQTKKAVPEVRLESDTALLSNEDLKALLENNEGVDFIEKLYNVVLSKLYNIRLLQIWLNIGIFDSCKTI